jgi:hypothetical protein
MDKGGTVVLKLSKLIPVRFRRSTKPIERIEQATAAPGELRKTPVRKTAKKGVAKKVARKAPVRKAAKKRVPKIDGG